MIDSKHKDAVTSVNEWFELEMPLSFVRDESRTSPSRSPRFINNLGLRAPDPALKHFKFSGSSERDDDPDDPREELI